MKIFLDSLDVSAISKYSRMGIIRGITTNPTLARRFKMDDDADMVKQVRDALGEGEIHVEAFGDSAQEIVDNAVRILNSTGDSSLVFKIPFNEDGVAASKTLVENDKVKTSLHLVFSINQALLAASVGSTYICPLVGRLDDIGHDAMSNIRDIVGAYKTNGEKTLVIVSSVRHPQHILQAYQCGADAATVPLNVLQQMFQHPLTAGGFAAFKHDLNVVKPIRSCKINSKLIVQEGDSMGTCLSLMAAHRAGAVAVCRGDRIAGVFTSGDLKRLVAGEHAFDLKDSIAKYMSTTPVAVDVREQVSEAVEAISTFKVDQIIVVDDGSVVGVMDARDLLC